jgi:hypothetical protein
MPFPLAHTGPTSSRLDIGNQQHTYWPLQAERCKQSDITKHLASTTFAGHHLLITNNARARTFQCHTNRKVRYRHTIDLDCHAPASMLPLIWNRCNVVQHSRHTLQTSRGYIHKIQCQGSTSLPIGLGSEEEQTVCSSRNTHFPHLEPCQNPRAMQCLLAWKGQNMCGVPDHHHQTDIFTLSRPTPRLFVAIDMPPQLRSRLRRSI